MAEHLALKQRRCNGTHIDLDRLFRRFGLLR